MHLHHLVSRFPRRIILNILFVLAVPITLITGYMSSPAWAYSTKPTQALSINEVFSQASSMYGVPVELLKAICYMEGRISNNGGSASRDNGFGCMHLVKNSNGDTLDRAAQELGMSINQLKQDLPTNIFGGAAILHDDALQLSSAHTLPTSLAGWYGAVAMYSNASIHPTALLYADTIYKILKQGFNVQIGQGATVTLSAQTVTPDIASAATFKGETAHPPSGCTNDGNVDYPGAIDCILNPPTTYDCNNAQSPSDCNYTSSDRPSSCTVNYPTVVVTQPCKIDQIVIHDTEGSLTSALNVFQCPAAHSGCEQSSVHYIIDSDGTVYQVLREHDIAYHDGNFWSNMHSIGIEHVGYDATGFQWYNSAQYLASAKLVAYLLKKYSLSLDRSYIVAHGTVPASSLVTSPNHVDPGPYWLWDYYFKIINGQGIPFPKLGHTAHTIKLHTQKHLGPGGTESPADFNFYYLYNGPSTASGLIPHASNGTDITDETDNVEADMSYYYLAKVKDPAGTGDTLYEIWYGEADQVQANPPSQFANGHLAWLAVPPGVATEGSGTPIALNLSGAAAANVYGRPTTNSLYVIGNAPNSAVFVSGYTIVEDGTTNVWFEINYNHRQAYVPASEVTVFDLNSTPALHP